ncbi:PREDICTED: putative uncharacterized protein C1orf220 [Rhinopithecus bieti]|uniref:putative uncharacterized protein C1orf220 n=1 Tax=Rhinopithecus bieti TaxID=61621 RepID=UPI00083C8555|nr:PREDICTED: putative uncharacterized protein C1orf220 [Rhinopithecus bieti]
MRAAQFHGIMASEKLLLIRVQENEYSLNSVRASGFQVKKVRWREAERLGAKSQCPAECGPPGYPGCLNLSSSRQLLQLESQNSDLQFVHQRAKKCVPTFSASIRVLLRQLFRALNQKINSTVTNINIA